MPEHQTQMHRQHVLRTLGRARKPRVSPWHVLQNLERGDTHVKYAATPLHTCHFVVAGDRIACVHDRPLGRWEVLATMALTEKPFTARTRQEVMCFVRYNAAVAQQHL